MELYKILNDNAFKYKNRYDIQCKLCHVIWNQEVRKSSKIKCRKCFSPNRKYNQNDVEKRYLKENITLLSKYETPRIRNKLKCNICGHIWMATFGNFKSKNCGCPNCFNYGFLSESYFRTFPERNYKDSTFYIVRIFNEYEDFVKCGITTKKLSTRFVNLSKYNYQYEPLQTVRDDLHECWKREENFKNRNKRYRYVPAAKFKGHTECYTSEVLDASL